MVIVQIFIFLSESNHNVVKSIERLISQGLSECERSVNNLLEEEELKLPRPRS